MTRQFLFRAAVVLSIAAAGSPAVAAGHPAAAAAQQSVSATDIQRLQDQAYQAGSEISRLRSNDANLASRLESELDDLRDDIVYLKVKLRKEGSVNRTEYSDIRDRLQELRGRARGEAGLGSSTSSSGSSSGGSSSGVSGGVAGGAASGSSGGVSGEPRDTRRSTGQTSGRAIPEGQEIDVRLETQLSSDNAQPEDRFRATTVADLYRGNDVLIPAGSVMRGVVSSVNRASRTDRKGTLTVAFDQITINGRTYPMRGTVTQALESEGIRGEAGRIGAGAGVGAIIGGIIGGVKGALLGVLIGGGGTIAATEGKDVTLPAGTILRVQLDQPPNVR
jgi:TolA-binding protein